MGRRGNPRSLRLQSASPQSQTFIRRSATTPRRSLTGGAPDEFPDRYTYADPARPTPVPRVLIHGTADDTVPIALSRDYAAPARLIEIPGADHFAVIDPKHAAWHTVLRKSWRCCNKRELTPNDTPPPSPSLLTKFLVRIRLNSLSGVSLADQQQPPQGPPPPPPDGPSILPGMGGGDGGNKNLIPVNIEDEMQRSYLDYAMSVIIRPRASRYPRRAETGAPAHPVRHVRNGAHAQPAYHQVRQDHAAR